MTIKSKLSDKDRNQPCPCGSELKQKNCHNDLVKLQLCNKVAQMYMMRLIQEERKKRGIDPYMYTCNSCGQGTDQPETQTTIATTTPILTCPSCGNIVTKNEPEKKEETEPESKIILES